jgi:hypothetical protein
MCRKILASTLLLIAVAFPATATMVRPLDLDEMIALSQIAFEGTCTGNRSERDPATQVVVTYTTFAVHDVLKGAAGTSYEIKQIGGELPQGLSYRPAGIPKFEVGTDYIVFLPPASDSGFASPVGLAQGRFIVKSTSVGPVVGNGRDFKQMTAGIPLSVLPPKLQAPSQAKRAAAAPVRELGLNEFKELVRSRAGATR